jgi:HPt (histidine-containing phosphotransfer) domain-containing protein
VDGFDRASLDRLRETVGEEMFVELANDFVADIPRITKKIVRALEVDDLDALQDLAHELKGVAVLFGAADLAEACTRIMKLESLAGDDVRASIDDTLALSDAAARLVQATAVTKASP